MGGPWVQVDEATGEASHHLEGTFLMEKEAFGSLTHRTMGELHFEIHLRRRTSTALMD